MHSGPSVRASVGESRLQESTPWCGPRGRGPLQTGISLCRRMKKTSDKRPCTAFSGLFKVGLLHDPKDSDWPKHSSRCLGASPGLEHGAQRLQRYLPNTHLDSGCPTAAMFWKTILPTAQLPGSQAALHIAVNSQFGLSHAPLPPPLPQHSSTGDGHSKV